jgi:hypothetical protein
MKAAASSVALARTRGHRRCPAHADGLGPADRGEGGHYLVGVKDNQPRLHAAVAAYVSDAQTTARSATTVDRRRGRTEIRLRHASTRLSAYLRRYFGFPRLGQVKGPRSRVRCATARARTRRAATSSPV